MKVLVAHPYQQHSYYLAEALYSKGMLDTYITTVYNKPFSVTRQLGKVLRGRTRDIANRKRMPHVPDSKVMQFCEIEGLFKILSLRVPILNKKYNAIKKHLADRFAKKVARVAIKHDVDAVIMFDDTSPLCFEILQREAPDIIRIVDMSAGNILYMKAIYEEDFELKPEFKNQLLNERACVFDSDNIERAAREIASAQFFLCGSSFVVRSLMFSGVSEDKCFVCPYGVDLDTFDSCNRENRRITKPIEFCFVGGTKELKGISYLLDAFLELDPNEARITVVGANTLSGSLLDKYSGKVTFTGQLQHVDLANLLKSMDVMVFPSLGDGFGLAVIEGLASGLPVIISENSGVVDILTDGVDSFVIPIQSQSSIVDNVRKFVNDPELVVVMSNNARETAERFSWETYSETVTSILERMMHEEKKNNTSRR